MDYQFAKTDFNKMTSEIFELLKPLAGAKKLEFTFASPGHEVWVSADAEKLKQVVQNITDNAIKYTPNGFVKIELKEEGGAAVVSVSDSGLGIPSELIPHLFEEFVRDERVKKQILGTGFGLFIARKIAEAHGGKIWAESAGEGKGSTFSVSMPIVKKD
jgi:signal transduction histidine kinase